MFLPLFLGFSLGLTVYVFNYNNLPYESRATFYLLALATAILLVSTHFMPTALGDLVMWIATLAFGTLATIGFSIEYFSVYKPQEPEPETSPEPTVEDKIQDLINKNRK